MIPSQGACTAVLFTVPREIASRLEGFLQANGIACRTQRNDMTPEQIAAQMLRQTQPGAARVLDTPFVGRMMRAKLRKDVNAEVEFAGSTMPAMFDVLVRPEDLPTPLTAAEVAPTNGPTALDGPNIVLCERPWDRAWEIVGLLGEHGIQAAILPNEESTPAPSIDSGMFRVGVRPQDLEQAQILIEG